MQPPSHARDHSAAAAPARRAPSRPKMSDAGLEAIHQVRSHDQFGTEQTINIVGELPLTIKVDGKELVTLMTLGTHPERLVLGYLRNQTLFARPEEIVSVMVDWEHEVAEVATVDGNGVPGLEAMKRTVTTGCGQGTVLSCTLDKLYAHRLPEIRIKQSDIYRVLAQVARHNKAYRLAGSVHGCGLCAGDEVLMFIEDVGRHNAMDTIAGEMWLQSMRGDDKIFYTTGRLTSEIVMKAALMGIPALVSRNGATHMGFELAEDLGVTLIARAKSRHFVALNADNLVFDQPPEKSRRGRAGDSAS
ncbi:MAG: formate dehydrogenase accessory sulfurtransferase FdhD [bacterium]